jgi:hypothetical protein
MFRLMLRYSCYGLYKAAVVSVVGPTHWGLGEALGRLAVGAVFGLGRFPRGPVFVAAAADVLKGRQIQH